MGILRKGILGGFSGAVGPVVVNGDKCLLSGPGHVKKLST